MSIRSYTKNNSDTLKTLLLLAWPTLLQELLSTIIQYVDTAMVGHLGPVATATVSLSSTYSWLINSVIYAFGVGFLSYIARAIGEGDRDKIEKTAGLSATVALVIGAVLTVVTLVIAPFMPVWMGAEEGIRHDASLYFMLINFPLIFRSFSVVFGAVIQSTGDTKTPMKVNLIMNIANTLLNYVFIYVLSFGAVGAGIASCISYVLGGILMTRAFLLNRTLSFKISNMKPDGKILKGTMNIAVPLVFTQIASCSGYVVATSFVSAMATTVYAAHSIAITAEQLFYIPGYGVQAATSTLIGNALGENNKEKEHSVMVFSVATIFLTMCVTGLLLFIFAPQMMSAFTSDKEVIRIGAGLLRIVAFTEPIFGTAAVLDGIYSGLGKTRFPFVATMISRWGVRIVGSFFTVKVLGGGIREIWYCMIGDNITKALLLAIGLFIILKKEK